jgi:hypothetical protein
LAIDIVGKFNDLELSSDEEDMDEDCQIISDNSFKDRVQLEENYTIRNLKIQTVSPKQQYEIFHALPMLETIITYNFFTKSDINFLGEFN